MDEGQGQGARDPTQERAMNLFVQKTKVLNQNESFIPIRQQRALSPGDQFLSIIAPFIEDIGLPETQHLESPNLQRKVILKWLPRGVPSEARNELQKVPPYLLQNLVQV